MARTQAYMEAQLQLAEDIAAMNGGPNVLPRVRIDGKTYFLDARLRELRNILNPCDRIPL